jgi:ribosome biogenesis GTPase / thiamine phosphate phosphatase
MSEAGRAPILFEARVVAGYGRHVVVEDGAGRLYEGQRRGKRGDVVIGDRVRCQLAGAAQAAIDSILPRASLLMRADGARSKALAANVDRVVVVFALGPPSTSASSGAHYWQPRPPASSRWSC